MGAICKSFGLAVGAASAPIVKCLLVVCSPIAWPIGKILDCALGHDHGTVYRRPQMSAIVDIHTEQGHLTQDEAMVIQGAMDLAQKGCLECITAAENVKSLGADAKMDAETMDWILSTGYSRIPVRGAQPGTFLGNILIKRLLKLRPEDETPVSELELHPILHVSATCHLYELLDIFQTGRSHMAAVYREGVELTDRDRPPADAEAIGILTLEDVIEELLKEEIVDETDQYVDNAMQTGDAREVRGTTFSPFALNDATPRRRGLINMLSRATSAAPTFRARAMSRSGFFSSPNPGQPSFGAQRIRRAVAAPSTFPGVRSARTFSGAEESPPSISLNIPLAQQQYGQ